MSRDSVQAAMALPVRSFKRTSDSNEADCFGDGLAFAYYSADGTLEAVEFSEPAIVLLDGVDLLAIGYKRLRALLAARDPRLVEDEDGLTSNAVGVGAYAPQVALWRKRKVESVIAFMSGYYD